MTTQIDMTYRFLWDSEPTDEQLLALMQEVGEEVRSTREKTARQVIENLEREYARVISTQQSQ